ncbi:hypothetical protein LTR85_002914 [Meristemomyces frigidus]|nr:hypothetical protein LTR85_002914 [Meristemomyces frigidus]
MLGGGVIYPFLATPVALDHVGRELVANIFHANEQRPHREDWFTVALNDQATFHQVLANSALHLYGLHHGTGSQGGGGAPKLAVMYHQLALKSVRKRLEQLQDSDRACKAVDGEKECDRNRTVDALIRCVSGMICFATWLHRFQTDHDHVSEDETQRRSALLRTTQIRMAWAAHFPSQPHPPWLDVLPDLTLLSALADADFAGSPVGSGLENMRELPVWTNVLIHRLLRLHQPTQRLDDARKSKKMNPRTTADALAEACRMSMLLFLAPIWRAYGVRPTPTKTLLQKQHDLLLRTPQLWRTALSDASLGRLLLWILCVSALEAVELDGHGDREAEEPSKGAQSFTETFTQTLLRVAALTGTVLRVTEDLEKVMKGTLWVGEVFHDKMRALAGDIGERTAKVAATDA